MTMASSTPTADHPLEYSTRDLAATVASALAATRKALQATGSRDELIGELEALQSLDREVQIHLNRIAAEIYDSRHPKHWLWREHKQWILDRVSSGQRVLDIGCGCSAYLQWMADAGCLVTAVDIRDDVLEIARRTMQHANLEFVNADITTGPPPTKWGGTDVAVCSHVIEHLDDPVEMLRALRDITPRAIIAVPPIHSRWQKLMFKDLGLLWKDDEDHRREYTADMLVEQLTVAGWAVKELHDGIDIKAVAE